MKTAQSMAMTLATFDQRETHRRSLFSHTWCEVIPKVFEDVPKYYRIGNVVASFGLWELWVWQFVRTIKLESGYHALDVCAGTNDIGIRLLQNSRTCRSPRSTAARKCSKKGRAALAATAWRSTA